MPGTGVGLNGREKKQNEKAKFFKKAKQFYFLSKKNHIQKVTLH